MGAYIDNAYPVQKGKVNLTTGALGATALCVADGSITVTWEDDSTDVLDMVAGDAIDLRNAKSAVVTTGTFHG